MKITKVYITEISLLTLLALIVASSNFASAADQDKTIRITGRKSIVVTTTQVRLGDIAEISSKQIKDDEAVIGLQKVIIGDSPEPGKRSTFTAHRIVERLLEEGVSLDRVGYVLPRVVSVERAARQLGVEEITTALHDYLAEQKREITIREVKLSDPIFIAPGDVNFQIRTENNPYAGHLDFLVTALVAGEQPVSFRAKASCDEWRQVPVARRHIGRGSVVEEEDVIMARLNVGDLPKDASLELDQIIGQKVEGEVAMGDAFRGNRLQTPAIISAGSRVVLLYRTPLLEASASGVALESGSQDQEIRVRNVGSKKIVSGKVIEPGLVMVGP